MSQVDDGSGGRTQSRGLGRSASDPGIRAAGKSSLKAVGLAASNSLATTNLYDKMKGEGLFRDYNPQVNPAGRSTTVPLNDSAGMDVQPDIYYPLPNTPIKDRRFRRSHVPGEIHVHHSLKDQKLPGEDFRYGMRNIKGATTEQTMKAGQRFGIDEYKHGIKEKVYESNKREPLGQPYIRGHQLQMLPEGFGNASGVPVDSKKVIFPVENEADGEDVKALYRRSHNHYQPGEKVNRDYNWPKETQDTYFRFGVAQRASGAEGEGVRLALSTHLEDDGQYQRTVMVPKVCEDFRNVAKPKFAAKVHYVQGATGPPLPVSHAYGVKSISSDCTARSCILGYYSLPEQLPDEDLGRCQKPGRRNLTTETRPFGTPSVRTDIPAPVARSCADMTNYGDECGAAALLNPQRFDDRGVPDREFLLRRPKEELRSLVDAGGYTLNEASMDFDTLFDEAADLFDDGLELVSLDAFLYVYSRQIDNKVHKRLAGPAALAAQARMQA